MSTLKEQLHSTACRLGLRVNVGLHAMLRLSLAFSRKGGYDRKLWKLTWQFHSRWAWPYTFSPHARLAFVSEKSYILSECDSHVIFSAHES